MRRTLSVALCLVIPQTTNRNDMNDSVIDPITLPVSAQTTTLFMWRGSGIVLLGEQCDDRWVLARAWLQGDRLEYVRRWSFAEPIAFSRQVRRLVMDASGDSALARDEGQRAISWTEAIA
jgi:hypothetical protein